MKTYELPGLNDELTVRSQHVVTSVKVTTEFGYDKVQRERDEARELLECAMQSLVSHHGLLVTDDPECIIRFRAGRCDQIQAGRLDEVCWEIDETDLLERIDGLLAASHPPEPPDSRRFTEMLP